MSLVKIFSLGHEDPVTGEPRVRILSDSLVKEASGSSEIQLFWDKLEKNKDYAYLWVIACGAHEYYGCNNNGDSWTEKDLMDTHHRFTTDAHVFLHHINKDPNKSIGVPIFSWYNPNMHRIELVLQLDKNLPAAAQTVRKITAGEPITVSIGAHQKYDVCSICGAKAASRSKYCSHLKYNLKKILSDGRQVFTFNPDPKWFDISIVSKPAFSPAYAIDKIASDEAQVADGLCSSAALGEMYVDAMEKVAAVSKVADIIKRMEGIPVAAKDDTEVPVDTIKNMGLENLPYPQVDMDSIERDNISPGAVLRVMIASGVRPSIPEAAFLSGRAVMGQAFTQSMIPRVLSALLPSLSVLGGNPHLFSPLVHGLFNSYGGELEEPEKKELIIKLVLPTVEARAGLDKEAAFFAPPPHTPVYTRLPSREASPVPGEHTTVSDIAYHFNTAGPGAFDKFVVAGPDGSPMYTTRADIHSNNMMTQAANIAAILGTTALMAGSVTALFASPTILGKVVPAAAVVAIVKKLWDTSPTGVLGDRASDRVQTTEKFEIPANTRFYKLTKSAAINKALIAPALGAAVPASLAVDYWLTKKKYGDINPYYRESMSGSSATMHDIGEAVADHPAMSLTAGAILGSAASAAMRMRTAKLLANIKKTT